MAYTTPNPQSPIPKLQAPIFVRATLPGPGGIATLLLDGESVISLLEPRLQCARSLREDLTPNPFPQREGGLDSPSLSGKGPGVRLLFARLFDAAERVVDELLVAVLKDKQSPTGNTQLELSCHGGEGAVAAVEDVLLAAGFSRGTQTDLLARAHLNGKLSLIACEARLRLARAVSARQADFLLGHKAFQKRWERLGFEMALGLRTKDEAWRPRLQEAARAELARAPAALALLARHHVVLCGPVNAGKSSLANRLARSERHIVSAIPGTTLDRLDIPLALRGLNLLLTDTAGLSEPRALASGSPLPGCHGSDNELEAAGRQRGQEAAAAAALRLLVLDGSLNPGEQDLALAAQFAQLGPVLLVLNKQDLGLHEAARGLSFLVGREPVVVSARTGFGLEELEEAIEAQLLGNLTPGPFPEREGENNSPPSLSGKGLGVRCAPTAFTRRQIALLERLQAGLEKGNGGAEAINPLREMVGTRPDAEQLALVLEER